MKPLTHRNQFFQLDKVQIKPLCENVLSNLSSWLWQLPLPGASYGLVWIKRQIHVHVFKALSAGLLALVNSTTVNKRIYVGLVLMLACAPLSYCSYALFEKDAPQLEGWFHYNHFHLFFLIRFQIAFSVFFIGLYHYLGKSRRVKILAIPLGFLFMSIAVNVMAESNEDIWRIANLSLWGAGICLSLTIFYGLDYFAWRKFHRADSFEAREKGLYQIAYDVDPEKFRSMVMETWRQKNEFNTKY